MFLLEASGLFFNWRLFMAYNFNDGLAPPQDSNFALLDSKYLSGGFRIVQTVAELDTIPNSSCVIGMLVRCLEDSKLYELEKLTVEYDENWEEIYVKVWKEFLFVRSEIFNEPKPKPLNRWSLPFRSTLIQPEAIYSLRIPVARLVCLESISVDKPCKIWIKETESPLQLGDGSVFNQILEHEFTSDNLIFDPSVKFPDGTKLRSRYTKIFMNKDPNIDKYIYYSVQNTGGVATNITAKFLFIALQIG